MSIDQIAAEARRLPPKERALLAGSLWESLEDPFAAHTGMDEAVMLVPAAERIGGLNPGRWPRFHTMR